MMQEDGGSARSGGDSANDRPREECAECKGTRRLAKGGVMEGERLTIAEWLWSRLRRGVAMAREEEAPTPLVDFMQEVVAWDPSQPVGICGNDPNLFKTQTLLSLRLELESKLVWLLVLLKKVAGDDGGLMIRAWAPESARQLMITAALHEAISLKIKEVQVDYLRVDEKLQFLLPAVCADLYVQLDHLGWQFRDIHARMGQLDCALANMECVCQDFFDTKESTNYLMFNAIGWEEKPFPSLEDRSVRTTFIHRDSGEQWVLVDLKEQGQVARLWPGRSGACVGEMKAAIERMLKKNRSPTRNIPKTLRAKSQVYSLPVRGEPIVDIGDRSFVEIHMDAWGFAVVSVLAGDELEQCRRDTQAAWRTPEDSDLQRYGQACHTWTRHGQIHGQDRQIQGPHSEHHLRSVPKGR